jgi:hypothetical protein
MTPTAAWGRALDEGRVAVKNLKWAACLGIVVAAFGTGVPAFAAQSQDLQATTVTVTSSKPTALTGAELTFRAMITPNLIAPRTHITGTVTWTITGSDSTTVPCQKSSVVTVKNSGRVSCRVNKALLQAEASSYTVQASYSGDSNFAPGVGTLSQTVTIKQPNMIIRFPEGPSNGGPSIVTATVTGGVGSPLLTGNVIFSIASNVATACTNGSTVPHSTAKSIALGSDGSNANVATCQLPAGWITVPPSSNADKHPKTRWTITATFEGNGNFLSVFERAKRGVLR